MLYLGHDQALRISIYHSNSPLLHSKGIIQVSRENAQERWGVDTLCSSKGKDGVYGSGALGLFSCGDGAFLPLLPFLSNRKLGPSPLGKMTRSVISKQGCPCGHLAWTPFFFPWHLFFLAQQGRTSAAQGESLFLWTKGQEERQKKVRSIPEPSSQSGH